MGGGQSHEEKAMQRGENAKEDPETNKPGSSPSKDTPGELPQSRMGNKTVDNMSFMISCTNWY